MDEQGALTTREGLHAQLLRDDVQAYRNLETWGSSLFLGAIALVGKQLFEWDHPVQPPQCTQQAILPAYLFILPAAVGLVAFIFLRTSNYRGRKARERLQNLTCHQPFERKTNRLGLFGWIIAFMPFIFGYFVSGCLSYSQPDRQFFFDILRGVGFFVLLAAVIAHLIHRGFFEGNATATRLDTSLPGED